MPSDLLDAFLTQEHTARKTLLKKAVAPYSRRRGARGGRRRATRAALQEGTAAELVARSEAVLDVVAAISRHYEAAKRARSLLDFDDLIEKLAGLLKDEAQGLWVRYKLDAGLSHVLVDEGQDTNPQQWEVIGALIDDFFFGESAADRPRTLFAVGDQKQSIFSFQGADPEVFVDAGRQYAFSAKAAHFEIAPVPLHFSFRTLPNVLEAVDIVFQRCRPDGWRSRGDGARTNGAGRGRRHGDAVAADPGRGRGHRPRQLADRAAAGCDAERAAAGGRTHRARNQAWIDAKRPLGPRGRAVRADDVLILVQVRSVLFHEIIRALIRAGIPTPGADRLAVTTHIGVLDMMALGDVLLNPADDLQLAALLRSPLFEVSEDDLLAVARPRGENQRLYWAMRIAAFRRSRPPSRSSKTGAAGSISTGRSTFCRRALCRGRPQAHAGPLRQRDRRRDGRVPRPCALHEQPNSRRCSASSPSCARGR
jgi:ATP-dependent helicase/nuclease subunit A